jgi:hypothetical protein
MAHPIDSSKGAGSAKSGGATVRGKAALSSCKPHGRRFSQVLTASPVICRKPPY